MKAYVLNAVGGVENLSLSEVPTPSITEDEVLINSKAISVNPVDTKVRPNKDVLSMIMGTEEMPVILGWDVAGTVAAVGNNVREFQVGDKVFGMINFPGQGKAYAEYVAAQADHLSKIPQKLSFEQAAATTLAALTALQVLRSRVNKKDRVLIHAGSGGVGHFAIQIAKDLGAFVIATSSAKNREFVMSLGADEHIDYQTQKFQDIVSDIDFVIDGMGGEVLENSLKVVKSGGKIVSLPTHNFSKELELEADQQRITLEFVLVQSSGSDMGVLKDMLESRKIIPHVSKVFSFADLPDAHRQIESGRTVGKVVVTLS